MDLTMIYLLFIVIAAIITEVNIFLHVKNTQEQLRARKKIRHLLQQDTGQKKNLTR